MKILNTIFILIILGSMSNFYGQDFQEKDLIKFYWGLNKYKLSASAESDTIELDRQKKKENLLSEPYRGGFIFHKNGNFTEILNRRCNQDRLPYTGNWTLKNDTLEIVINDNLTWYFKIISISKDVMIIKMRKE